jgi:hypothetical protein
VSGESELRAVEPDHPSHRFDERDSSKSLYAGYVPPVAKAPRVGGPPKSAPAVPVAKK